MGRVGVGRILGNRQSGREVKGRSLVYLFPGTVVVKYHEKAEMYSLAVLEARSPESRCRQGHAPSESSRGGSILLLREDGCCPKQRDQLRPVFPAHGALVRACCALTVGCKGLWAARGTFSVTSFDGGSGHSSRPACRLFPVCLTRVPTASFQGAR